VTGGQVIEVVSFTVFDHGIHYYFIVTLEIVEICIRSVSESDY
jgi:hypothetical protein